MKKNMSNICAICNGSISGTKVHQVVVGDDWAPAHKLCARSQYTVEELRYTHLETGETRYWVAGTKRSFVRNPTDLDLSRVSVG
ncbi:hypothetical protein LCGC14_2641940 [marine sediment metagenome]|uniref:Uncharacterized protein n=1 Tax=marine sediment metagenome TaxID=412755 RepID=A0A0F9C805_9ZZZZ